MLDDALAHEYVHDQVAPPPESLMSHNPHMTDSKSHRGSEADDVGSEPGSESEKTSQVGSGKTDARGTHPNKVRKLRIERMMSKAELARRAGLSVLTIDRVEKGYPCRLRTKRKILEALDLGLAERVNVFGEEE